MIRSPSDPSLDPQTMHHHLRSMRRTTLTAFGLVALAAPAAFFLPRLEHALIGRTGASLLGAAAALWIGFSANRDARSRMDRIKRAFAVHDRLETLLRDHHRAYLLILARLLAVAACGVIVAIWGAGPALGSAFFGLAGILIVMTWPTEHKTRLLIRRAQALQPGKRE